jgi:2-polyprenyl-3-methyl-5-hydroxy-6-metoxy-1,4-benzoquinol methylase
MSSASFLPDQSPAASYHEVNPIDLDRASTSASESTPGLLHGIARRWRRERRRRKVGRAYDMAREIAGVIPHGARLLDVGCGNGYIAHHLSALLDAGVVGIDLGETTEAAIDYRPFNGMHFPVEAHSFDAVLFCYVLHHVQNVGVILDELARVLRDGGRVVVYEDIPETWWDRLVCAIHNRKWRNRTGPCSFYSGPGWRELFHQAGLEVLTERRLSRWRNLAHPVRRRLFLLTPSG